MLNENEIIDAVERAFNKHGYKTDRKCSTKDCGVDLHVRNEAGREWRIEAKGGTSAATSSKRFGMPFDPSQVSVHVAKAIHQAMALRAKHRGSGVAIALPDEKYHRQQIAAVGDALDQLGIPVIWVSETEEVQLPASV